MRHPNETMIRSSYDAASTGDLQPILDILSDEIRWNVSGDSALAGDYNGKDAVLRFFGAIARQYDNTLNVQVREVLVNDHHAVALTAESGTVDGHQLEWTSGTSSRSSAPRASGWTGVREMFVQKTGLSTGPSSAGQGLADALPRLAAPVLSRWSSRSNLLPPT